MENNSEHLEKRNKEFSRWILDLCRTCKHTRLYHLFDDANVHDEKFIHSNCNFIVDPGGFCECKEWLPQDNLEYIELLAKRKGLIPEEKDDK